MGEEDACYLTYAERPNFEFEGWLVGDYPTKIWVRGALRNGLDPDIEIQELTVYRLNPGEEVGEDWAPCVF